MKLIQQITDAPLQTQKFVLDDANSFLITIYFVPRQQGWFITNLTFNTFILNGIRISNSVNMLHQFHNIIPFGLACISTANREPSLQKDFSSGASRIYVLSKDETTQYAEYLKIG